MTILLGDKVPNFKNAQTTEGKIEDFYDWGGNSWVILFSHPKDFTPVCTTELGYLAKINSEFKKRNTKLLALSVDDLESHKAWVKDIEEINNCQINYPIIADTERKIANLYDMIHPSELNDFTIRSVFIIDPDKILRLSLAYPASTGRNFDEILRALDALQLTNAYKVATPVNWQKGEDCIVAYSVNDEEADKLFPNITRVKPYLRYTAVPKS